jgi:hypothetical protein
VPGSALAQNDTIIGQPVSMRIPMSKTRFDAKAARENLDPGYCYRTALKLKT